MNNSAMLIGIRLSMLREENGFTQEDVQRLTGINRSTYSKNESGKSVPSLTNLRKFAKIYGVSLDFLCGEDENSETIVLNDSGRPPMTKEEKMLVSYYRLLDDETREEILKMMEEKAIEATEQ